MHARYPAVSYYSGVTERQTKVTTEGRCSSSAKPREHAGMVDENGPHYFVAFQTPGPKWVQGLKYNEQPDFMNHVGYMTELQDKGLTVLSGPFMEKAGGLNGVLADGGMTIFR